MKGSTKRIENLKDFVTELNLIEKFNSLDNYPINLINQDIEAKLSRGLIQMKYPDSQNHPSQIYLLTEEEGTQK